MQRFSPKSCSMSTLGPTTGPQQWDIFLDRSLCLIRSEVNGQNYDIIHSRMLMGVGQEILTNSNKIWERDELSLARQTPFAGKKQQLAKL